jgi:glycosyltransferase involved in cell wall biosynthesis
MSDESRVVMVSAGWRPALGGAERQAEELSRALLRRGVRVSALTRRLPGTAPNEESGGLAVRRLPSLGSGPLDSLLFLCEAFVWLVLHKGEYDAVHAHLAGSPALAAAAAGRLLGKPVLVKLGGGRGIGELAASSRTAFGRLKLRLLAALEPRFLAVVPDLADEAREFLGPGVAVEVLPNGVDAERFVPADLMRKRVVRASLGLPQDAPVFLYTGRFSPEKRLGWFAKLWTEATEGTAAVLVLAGAGPHRPEPGGRVRVLDAVDDSAPLYAAADVFVLPSTSEGLSNSLLEAMAAGLPSLASAVGGTAQTLENGRTGLLFGRDDEAALKAGASRLAKDPELRARLGAAAREEAKARYSLDTVAARLRLLYRGTEPTTR